MTSQVSELANTLNEIRGLVIEGTTELGAKIDDLEAALAGSDELPIEAVEALAALRASAQSLADIIPNAPAEEPVV
jgi:hypothetical protein